MYRVLSIIMCLIMVSLNSANTQSIYDFSIKNLDGRTIPMSAFAGRVLLIVNTASNGINTNQMAELEELYQKYKEKGFVILAFPSNDFQSEVAGDNQEVKAAYREKFSVTFPILAKVHVKEPGISPLYRFLSSPRTDPSFGYEVSWNYTKFLISRDGRVINRFRTTIEPNNPMMVNAIKEALAK